jgi:hypothetical protein
MESQSFLFSIGSGISMDEKKELERNAPSGGGTNLDMSVQKRKPVKIKYPQL